jgi:hypothetical protein
MIVFNNNYIALRTLRNVPASFRAVCGVDSSCQSSGNKKLLSKFKQGKNNTPAAIQHHVKSKTANNYGLLATSDF